MNLHCPTCQGFDHNRPCETCREPGSRGMVWLAEWGKDNHKYYQQPVDTVSAPVKEENPLNQPVVKGTPNK